MAYILSHFSACNISFAVHCSFMFHQEIHSCFQLCFLAEALNDSAFEYSLSKQF